ncbi:colicin transporter [Alloscardovia macacae]|nr:colicin transporter [Alloscardovia macacae]
MTNTNETVKKPLNTKLITIIAAVIALILIIAGGVWGSVVKRAQAVEACTKANTAYNAAYTGYEKAVKNASSVLESVPADQVADAKTRESLETLAKTSVKKTPAAACDINLLSAWTATTSTIDQQAQTLTATSGKLDKAVKAVQESQKTKQLNDAKSAAQAKLYEANQLYQSSDGKVADNQTRDQLKTALDSLTNTLNDTKASVEGVNTALSALQQTVDGVNASVQAKTDADNAAAAAAAAAQAQQQTAQAQAQRSQARSSQRSTQRAQTQQRSTNRSSSGSQRSQQAAPRANTPAPSGNSGSSSSGNEDWRKAWETQPPSPCEATHNCNLAVG